MRGALLVGLGGLLGAAFLLTRGAAVDAESSSDYGVNDFSSDTGNQDVFMTETESAPASTLIESFGDFAQYLIPAGFVMDNQNLQAFLWLIRTGEGTADDGGYSRLFGGGSFSSFADHPRQRVTRGSLTSTAAGAYQILSRTWDDLKTTSGYDFPDFSPESQDKAAIALIKRRGALADVLAGRFDRAITKTNKEWASLPDSPYGQPTLTRARARQILAQAGGISADGGSVA